MLMKLISTDCGWVTPVCIQPDDLEHFRSYPTLHGEFGEVMAELRKFLKDRIGTYSSAIPQTYYSIENPYMGADVSMYLKELVAKYENMKSILLKQNMDKNAEHFAGMRYDAATNSYDFLHKDELAESREEKTVEKPADDGSVTDYRLLLSTRRMLGFLGVDYYDGPEFKFESNKHPSPSASYLPTLAKEYMMKVIVPNALLAVKYGSYVGPVALEALDYCMTTGKCKKSAEAWKEARADEKVMAGITEKYNFYVVGVNRDGTPVKADHRCYFEKFVNLKAKDAKKFKKSKNTDVVADLIKRMEKEPELRKMSHRELMAIGISNRAARMFEEARKKA